MRFAPHQHIKAAQLLDDKSKVAIGKQKARLVALAASHRMRARQLMDRQNSGTKAPKCDRDLYAEVLPHFEAALAHLRKDTPELATLLPALVKHLASLGMDADEIRELKPYVKRFTLEVIAGRRTRTSMHQAAARYWNAIAESQPLKTEWAQQMFPLPQEDMDLAVENEEKRLMRETSDPVLASAYLKIMPLLWESAAISNYLKGNPSLRAAIPPIESITEAIMIAKKDFRLTTRELMKLAEMLKEPPTPNKALSLANSIIGDHKASVRKQRRYRAEIPRIAEALFSPSFHPETLLRVIADSDRTIIELTSAESILARRFTHKSVVAPNYAAQFWTELDAIMLVPFDTEEVVGLDGILVTLNCRTTARSAKFEVWSPKSTTHAGRLVDLIYNIAWETSSAAAAIECLEHLHGYLRDELPARIIEAPITRLRLFGCLTTHHQEALRQLFVELLHKGTLLIDMTNFNGMGTALYGAFIGFAALHPHLAFATSPSSRRHLEEMQISPGLMFDRVEDAHRFLESSG